MAYPLAVIIPAYKITFFAQALQSLADQTCKDFTVYIGDDASPDNLQAVAESFRGKLNISYTRFDVNMGAKNLVNQWRRCVELSHEEKWLWLFSDDDIADPSCVENFMRIEAVNKGKFDVYRFNTVVVDRDGAKLFDTPIGPMEESSEEMSYHLLLGQRGNSMPDHIFTREVFRRKGGFVHTDYAQGADWATSMLLSQEKGLAIIPDARIYWRYSGINVSSGGQKNRAGMVKGHIQFLKWVLNHFRYLRNTPSPVSFEMMLSAMRANIRNVFTHHFKGLTGSTLLPLFYFMLIDMRLPLRSVVADLRTIDVQTGNHLQQFSQLKTKIKKLLPL